MRFFKFIIISFLVTYSNYSQSDNFKITNDIYGINTYYTTDEKDTLISIARKFGISFADILSANDVNMDPWIPGKDKKLLIPKSHIMPFSKRDGIVINIGDLRLYYFEAGVLINTFPIGIGRSGWETPLGKARVVKKKKDPIWIPPDSVRKEDPSLPKVVAAGVDNPLGNRAIYLSMPSYLIHGTNKPYGVGMKVSHGCIRLYPEDIETLYDLVEEGTKVNIINQSIKAGWNDNKLYIEVHLLPDYAISREEKTVLNSADLYPQAYEVIQKAAGLEITRVDWDKVKEAVKQANGIPVDITMSE